MTVICTFYGNLQFDKKKLIETKRPVIYGLCDKNYGIWIIMK